LLQINPLQFLFLVKVASRRNEKYTQKRRNRQIVATETITGGTRRSTFHSWHGQPCCHSALPKAGGTASTKLSMRVVGGVFVQKAADHALVGGVVKLRFILLLIRRF